jgi:hypothetical protein
MLEDASRMNTTSAKAGFKHVGDALGSSVGVEVGPETVGVSEGEAVVGVVGEVEGERVVGTDVDGTVGALETEGETDGETDGAEEGVLEGANVVGAEEVGCGVVGVVGVPVGGFGASEGLVEGEEEGVVEGASEIWKQKKSW